MKLLPREHDPYRNALLRLQKECQVDGMAMLDADELEMILGDRLDEADKEDAALRVKFGEQDRG